MISIHLNNRNADEATIAREIVESGVGKILEAHGGGYVQAHHIQRFEGKDETATNSTQLTEEN